MTLSILDFSLLTLAIALLSASLGLVLFDAMFDEKNPVASRIRIEKLRLVLLALATGFFIGFAVSKGMG